MFITLTTSTDFVEIQNRLSREQKGLLARTARDDICEYVL